jgi:glycosyltransferase involved in cell wall biosynthesis
VLVRRFACIGNNGVYCVSPQLGWWLWRNADRFSVLHAHSYHTPVALQAAIVSRLKHIPLVLSPYYHGTGHTRLRRLMHLPYRLAGRWLVHQADALTCLSNAERDLLRHHFSVRVEPSIVPGSVDVAELRSQPRSDRLSNRTVVLAVSRLDAYKRTERLIAALPHLPDEYVIVIVGDGPERVRLLELAAQLKVTARVQLLNAVSRSELLEWYARADVFVSLSRHETFGLALLEAAVAGAPVVASDIPAYRETASFAAPGRIALVDAETSPHRLAAAIVEQVQAGPAVSVDGWALPTVATTVDGTLAAYARVQRSSAQAAPASTAGRPLRLLVVTPSYVPFLGGLETHVHEVVTRLKRAGVDVTVLTTDYTGELPTTEDTAEGCVRRVPSWPRKGDYYIAPDVYKTIRSGSWDIMHCHSYHTLVPPLAMLAAWRSGLPYVLTFHSGGHSSRLRTALRGAQWEILRPLLARADRLVAVSQFEATFFPKQLRLPVERFALISNGAEMPAIESVQTQGAGPLLMSVGRLERYKGHHRAIAALPGVLGHYPDARLRIVGDGPFKPQLRQLAQDLGVRDRVEIAGIAAEDRPGMATLLAQASLVLLLSEYEAYPVAVLEALAMQRQVLVADCSGMSELVDRGPVRAIPLNSSAEDIATAVVQQLQTPLPQKLLQLPTWDACADSLLMLYHQVMEERRCAS